MPASLPRSSSEPSLLPAGPLTALMQRTAAALRRPRAALRRTRAPNLPRQTAPPPPPPPDLHEIPQEFAAFLEGADLPFARKKTRLKFIEFSPETGTEERSLTRQEILAEIRQISAVRDRFANMVGPSPSPRFRRMLTPGPRAASPPRRRRSAAGVRGRPAVDSPAPPFFASFSAAESASSSFLPRTPPMSRQGPGPGLSQDMPPPPPPPLALPSPNMELRRAPGNRLTVRDMRQIDPSFIAKPAIWVREEALVVSLESVRAIILSDRMYVFDPDNEKVKTSLWHIKKRLANNMEDVFLPFEFRALEGILIHACIVLERDFTDIEPQLKSTLGDLPTRITNAQLEKLRQLEQRLNQFYSRARKVQHAIQVVLDEDEDMADMYLTEKRKNPGLVRKPMDHDEAEMLLETYLQMVDDLTSKAGLLNQAIDDSENLIEIHLDTTQNRVLLVDLIITAITTMLSFGTMITSIFGMNLPLPDAFGQLPTSNYYFWGCLVTTFSIMSIGLIILTRWCRMQGLYARRVAIGTRRADQKAAAVFEVSEEAKRQTERVLNKNQVPRGWTNDVGWS